MDFRYHYGTGHPSAVIAPTDPTQPSSGSNPNLVWLFYYDSQGWNSYGVAVGRTFILKSYDGYHFFRDSAGNLIRTPTNFGPGPMNVKYDSVNRHFIALVPYPDGHIVLNYTTSDPSTGHEDGTYWKWTTGVGMPPDTSLTIQTTPDYRITAGTPTFISFNDGSLSGVTNTTVIVAGEKPVATYTSSVPGSASVPGSHLYVNPEAINYSR